MIGLIGDKKVSLAAGAGGPEFSGQLVSEGHKPFPLGGVPLVLLYCTALLCIVRERDIYIYIYNYISL